MSYAELSYPFPDTPRPHHFHHIAAWQDHQLAERRRVAALKALDRRRTPRYH